MKNNERVLATSSKVLPIDAICMKCKGEQFSSDSSKRQSEVKNLYDSIPSDCVDSDIDGHKCPFKTGKAFVREQHSQKIPQHGDGFHNKTAVC